MTSRILSALALGAALLFASTSALALTEEERAKLAEPERGFYAEFDFGSLIFTGDAGANTDPGILTGFGLGSDIGKHLQIGVHMWAATNNSSGTVYTSNGTPPVTFLAPDAQTLLIVGNVKGLFPMGKRFNWTVRGSAGIMTGTPKPSRLFAFDEDEHVTDPQGGENSTVVGAGVGLEYYTRLRHFSIGAEASFDYVLGPGGLAIRLYPVIKYTF